MKKWLVLMLFAVFLTGCSVQDTFETIDDAYSPVEPKYAQVSLQFPEDAAREAMESGDGCMLYQCDGYDILLETAQAGDLNGTIRAMTGLDPDNLTILETRQGQWNRYDFVWCSAGDGGEMVGRGAVLDDGMGHYCLTAIGSAERAGELRESWNVLFQSFGLDGSY